MSNPRIKPTAGFTLNLAAQPAPAKPEGKAKPEPDGSIIDSVPFGVGALVLYRYFGNVEVGFIRDASAAARTGALHGVITTSRISRIPWRDLMSLTTAEGQAALARFAPLAQAEIAKGLK